MLLVRHHSGCAGDVASAVDFVCMLNCKRGLAEVQSVTNKPLPPAGIFDPPYAINVNLTQVPIGTKVGSTTLNKHAWLCLLAILVHKMQIVQNPVQQPAGWAWSCTY